MKKALILHGWEGHSEENWFPWLKTQLEKQDYQVIAPDLSNSTYPVLEEQLEDLAGIELQSGDLIIAHSLGSQLALQLIEQRKLGWVRVVLVAPTYNNLTDELWEKALGDAYQVLYDYSNTLSNFWQLNKLENKYTIFLSDDDPYINRFSAQEYYKPLENTQVVELSWKWHFNTSAWVLELPEILKYI